MSLSLRSIAALYRFNRSIHSRMRVPHPFRVLCGMGAMQSISIAFFSFVFLALPARAAANESIPTPEALAQLQQRAAQASPTDQCYLYAELVHGLTQQAAAQIAADDAELATATLRQIDKVAPLLKLNLTRKSKRLKDSELLLQDTTYRLSQMMHLLDGDDQASIQNTLRQLDKLNDEMMTQVFTQ